MNKFGYDGFEVMIEASLGALVLMDFDGVIVYLNNYAEEIFQYSKDELIGSNIEVLISKRSIDENPFFLQSYMSNPVRRNIGEQRELRLLKKDSSEFPVEIGLNPIDSESGKMVLATIIDISQKRMAEQQSEILLESVPNAIVLIDSKGEIVRLNKQFEELFGYEKDEITGEKLEVLVPKRFRKNHVSYRDLFIKDPAVRSMGGGRDLLAMKKDESEFPVEIGLNPVKMESGFFVLASIIDITERKKLEDIISEDSKLIAEQNNKLKLSEQELKDLNAAKDKFFSILAHDLKNPFNVILGYSNLLLEDFDSLDDEEKKVYISEINNSTKTTFSLFESLLNWGRVLQGNIQIIKEDVNVLNLVSDAIAPYTPNSRKKNIDVKIDISTDQIFNVDKYTMSIVIGNLINNAIKFTPNGGIISLSCESSSRHIKILIADNGVGMTKEQKDKIFKIEESTSTLGTNREKGTGLGLPLCKEFVEKNGGYISVESEVAKGSVFVINIPTV